MYYTKQIAMSIYRGIISRAGYIENRLCYDRDTVPVESALCRLDIRSSTARQSASKSAMAWRPLGLRINGVCTGAQNHVSTTPRSNRQDVRTLSNSWGSGREELGLEHRCKKSWKDREYTSAWLRGGSVSPNCLGSVMSLKGGSACASSQTVAPNDQTSTLRALYEPLSLERKLPVSRRRCRNCKLTS